MSVRPRPGAEVPELTARMARAGNPGGTTAMWVRDRLDGLWRDEDFADWYPRDGRPALSPAQLATVSVLQFLLGLSDRQAAEAVRCRIDFKYAMAMELDDPGSAAVPAYQQAWETGQLDSVGDLGISRCGCMISGHARDCFEGRCSCRGVRCRSVPVPVSRSRL